MTRYVGPTVETLLKRVREQGGIAVDENFATEIVSTCQRIVNIKFRSVIETSLMATKAEKLVYWIRTELPNCIDIITVSEEGRALHECKQLNELGAYDTDWFRKVDGTRFEAWHQMARDLFILYPGKAAISSVSVEYVKATTRHTDFSKSYNLEMELDDDEVEFALSIAETVLLTRSRKFESLEAKLKRLGEMLGE